MKQLLALFLLLPFIIRAQGLVNGQPFPQQQVNEALQKAWEQHNNNPASAPVATGKQTNPHPSGICHYLQQQTPGAKAILANTMKSGGTFLYIGATPHDTMVVTGNWSYNGPIAVVNDGVLIFNNANATILRHGNG